MTDAERDRLREEARTACRRDRAEQGLPPHVTDPDVIAEVARIAVDVLRAQRDPRPARIEPTLAGERSDGDPIDQQPE